ncbi:hypothetical protein DXG01_010211 [Tephrocybe rancida]|nr:hypothetical protein DXG01_010211 [Tephrocybe rancida]
MPHGCSVWPAYWSVGPNWPASGEIDIIEGVHEQNTNHYTLHTSSGCTLSTGKELITSEVLGKKCFSSPNSNSGCGFQDTDTRTYGHPFNELAGGVFAHLWDSGGIRVWHFARGEIPDDISAKKPDPSLWAPPVAVWSASACDINSHFHDHSLILDTTLCGDFGTPTFASNCTGTCAEAADFRQLASMAKKSVSYVTKYDAMVQGLVLDVQKKDSVQISVWMAVIPADAPVFVAKTGNHASGAGRCIWNV